MKTRASVSVTEVRAYGMRELRTQYNKNVMLGLLAAALIHMAIISAAYLSSRGVEPTKNITVDRPTNFGPSIFVDPKIPVGVIPLVMGAAKVAIGIPVPVPDFEINPSKTLATQTQMANGFGTGVETGTSAPGPGTEIGTGNGELNIPEDDPADFVAVEIPPVPVKQVLPEYPRLAREAGVEGTVWVKALVTKEGRVKKALIVKCDNEIFNDAAIAAAMQYVFTPAIMNSGPVAVWASIPFRFKLSR